MKTRISPKELKKNFKYVLSVDFCGLQHLLRCEEPAYYCADREGWMCDVYTFGDIAISTGYRPFGNVYPSDTFLRKYDKDAESVIRDYSLGAEEIDRRNNELLKKFLGECIYA